MAIDYIFLIGIICIAFVIVESLFILFVLKCSEKRMHERTKQLEHTQQSLLAIINSIPYGIVLIGKDKRIKKINECALAMMGYQSDEQMINKRCDQTLCSSEKEKCHIFESKQTYNRSDTTLVTRAGKQIQIIKTIVVIPIDGEEIILESFIDITERKKAEDQIRFLAYYDNLTHLPNRSLYKEHLTTALKLAQRHQRIIAVLFIDIDSFKHINDTLGHDIGDLLLQSVAKRLVKSVRNSDVISRYGIDEVKNTVSRVGGDEFIVLLNEIITSINAATVAERILSDLSDPFNLHNNEIFITASIGISLYPSDGNDIESLFKTADIAMYYAKEHGKNNYKFFNPTMNTLSLERLTLANELHRALERKELLLYYQPKIECATKKVVGIEVLIRWNHPVKGLISPSQFISLAEESGLITEIGDWVLHTACLQNHTWQKLGYEVLPLSINISRHQLEQLDFIEKIVTELEDACLESSLLELEITESTIMQDPKKSTQVLKKLKEKGIKIAIDDFGTGYSSLDHLKWLPLDALKIDLSFITNIVSHAEDAAITRTIINLAHSLKLKVIAEGVETEDQFEYLHSLGCNEAQGYLFSKPVPQEQCVQFLIPSDHCCTNS